MKSADRWQVMLVGQDREYFLAFRFDSPKRDSPMEDWVLSAWWQIEQRKSLSDSRAWWRQWLRRNMAGDEAPHFDFWAVRLPNGNQYLARLVPGPACGCCGQHWELELVHDRGALARSWRCPKHIGRLPCCIEGCGRTFKLQPDEHYGMTMICSTHWRLGPARLRAMVRSIRQKARRFGWTDQLLDRHHRIWHRCVREIRRKLDGGDLDLAEIERLLGA